MSTISPTRPSRRAAASRRKVVDSSDEDELTSRQTPAPEDDDDDQKEFTPAPISPKRQSRRKTTTTIPPTPKTGTRSRKTRTGDGIEPSEIFSADSAASIEPASPTKKASPRKRKSTAAVSVGARSRQSSASLVPPLPTPEASVSPEPESGLPRPLADITEVAINEKQDVVENDVEAVKVRPLPEAELPRPMDIVIKSRSTAIPVREEPTGPQARMVIQNLFLTNFKSYAGRQQVGPFHSSFSSVVGPNGSGKSNVIDSLLFVFGFRASKMRQGKISALIHNSARFPNLDYCEVEVHFHEVMDLPGGAHEIIPESMLVVSRKAFKNDSSKYYINGKTSTFTIVTTMLRDKGIDLDHKRFLILQGEVESIAQMKPKAANEHDDGLLEYLEDIIGTSKYKTPIEESAVEVETLNDVCAEKNTRVQHVEKEKNGLEEKKNKALGYVKDRNELAMKQSALYQIYVDECDDNLKVTEEAIEQMQAQLDQEVAKHEGSEEGIKQLLKHFKKGTKEYDSLEKETHAVVKEMAKYDRENVKFEEKNKFLENKQKKLEKTAHTSRLAASEAESSSKGSADDVERRGTQVVELEKELKVEETELANVRDNLKGKTQHISDQIAAKQKSLEPWNAKVAEKESAIAVAESELEILRERSNAGAVALEEAMTKVSAIEEARGTKVAELKDAKSRRISLEKDVEKCEANLSKIAAEEPELRSQLSGARQKADEARASLSNSQTQGNVLTGLMRLKETGRIEGFHGRLGNLGAIDQKYDVAISTACPALDNMVVDSVEVGQQCIDYLRKNNLGRANFICLDRLAQRDLGEIEAPENVARLFDLVKPKHDRFRQAFYSVLQNTLVAKDLTHANRIAYGARRWRVVTVDGQLIDKSGTMTGGGTRVSRGAMSSKIVAETSKEQVSKLELDRDALEQQFETFRQRLQDEEQTLKGLQDEIPMLETNIQKLNLEVDSLARNLTDAKQRVKELQAEHQPNTSNDKQMAALEKKVASLQSEVQKLNGETSGLEEEIKTLQDKIMEIGGVQLRGQKAKVDGLRERIDTLTEQISSAEVSKTKAHKQKIKHEKAKNEAEEEFSKVQKDLESLESDIQAQKSDVSDSKKRAEEAQDALEVKRDELATLKADLDEKTTELNSTRAVEIDMRNKLEENHKVLAENQKRARYWAEKLGKLSYQNLSDLGEEQESSELPSYTKDELADMSKDSLKGEIALLEEKTEKINVDLDVLSEYRRRVEEHASRSQDLNGAVAARDTAKKRCDDLRRLRLEGFMEGFSMISLRLKEMYQMITMGGNAELELVDSLDPFSEGILFSVMPPKKSWKNISNLSGGEKTLSSLALVFALHHYKPTPLYVMDEIDAALDFRNVSIVASYIKERTKNAQFIVISLRNNMFELASRLVGVYKVNHMTKSITIENRDYIAGRA
ncbi:MAG: hypothetical protein M1814_004031 [Vezdaea aestivalis]|nr:MAG: hypothetical protein M1814_004031 [Vezdaea aestivalis]